jgi:hypothetical protein
LVGLLAGLVALGELRRAGQPVAEPWLAAALHDLPLLWIMLYGCALHAAAGFMPRGIRWFGAALVLGGGLVFVGVHGAGVLAAGTLSDRGRGLWAHGLMGGFFGVLHLVYAVYLAVTERRRVPA